ncbi:MAG TPA: DUF3307 domain-containing protein [Gemmatimonadota bacterium]|nr:DUF3307 domain-containing protein [Gemmatimonadota bacterium]
MTSSSALLALLVAGHLLADFGFQTRRMTERKKEAGWLALHGLEVALVQAAVALPFLSWGAATLIAGLSVAHMTIDRLKASAARPSGLGPFLADQAGHLLVLIVGWTVWTRLPGWPGPLQPAFPLEPWTLCAVIAAAFAFNGTGGAAIVAAVLDRHRLDEVTDGITEEERSRGRTIGILERFILLTLVILGQWGALGFVIAAKSIARFKDLDQRDFSERYLIGTLASVLVAIASGLAVRGFWE